MSNVFPSPYHHCLSSSNLYAKGLKGDVYFFDGNICKKQDITKNNHITCVMHTPIGNICIGGHDSTLLVGSNGQWKILIKNRLALQYADFDDFAAERRSFAAAP